MDKLNVLMLHVSMAYFKIIAVFSLYSVYCSIQLFHDELYQLFITNFTIYFLKLYLKVKKNKKMDLSFLFFF